MEDSKTTVDQDSKFQVPNISPEDATSNWGSG